MSLRCTFEDLKEVLKDVLDPDSDIFDNLTGETQLYESGVDSISLIMFVIAIENKYNIVWDDNDLIIERLSTLNGIISIINRYLATNSG